MLESIGRKKRISELKEELVRINSIKFNFSNQYTEEQLQIIKKQKAELVVVYHSVNCMMQGDLKKLKSLSKETLELILNRINSVTFNYYNEEKYAQMVRHLLNVRGIVSQLLIKRVSPLEKVKSLIKSKKTK